MSDGLIHKSSTGISILVKWIFALIIIFILFKIFTIYYPEFRGDNIKNTVSGLFSNSDGGPDPRNGGKGFFNINSTTTKNDSIVDVVNNLLNKLGIPKINVDAYSFNSTNTATSTATNTIQTTKYSDRNIKYIDIEKKSVGVKYVDRNYAPVNVRYVDRNYAPRDVNYVNTNYAPRDVNYINLPR